MTHRQKRTSTATQTTIAALEDWFDALEPYNEEFPAKGTISGALVVLEHLKGAFNLDIESHTAKGGSQVKGASGTSVRRILATFGETRRFVAEGGRTNRGLRGDIRTLLAAIAGAKLEALGPSERNAVLEELQRHLVAKVREFHAKQRLECKYHRSQSAYQFISSILRAAKERGKEGPVGQYLVGAKLQLRFPEQAIENKSYSTADAPQEKHGDFLLGDTVFHVTVSPTLGLLEKCQQNIEDDLHPWLLVPERTAPLFRSEAEANLAGPFTLNSLEAFVSQNIAELAYFSSDVVPLQLLRLLEIYNDRVTVVEIDRSMLIDVPSPLRRLKVDDLAQ